jgi:hypothetical protein
MFSRLRWFQVYDLLEFMAPLCREMGGGRPSQFMEEANRIFVSECSGYRFVNGEIAPITNEHEIKAIEEAASTPFDNVNLHIRSATEMFSDRKNPNYRDSIKESISAVEAMCKIITGEKNSTLGECIKKLKESIAIHPALADGFNKLYGWTSNSGGIRHDLPMDDIIPDSEDAKYMLVSCSAFVNYLMEKGRKAGIYTSLRS